MSALGGAAYGLLALAFSRMLIRNLGGFFVLLAPAFGIGEKDTQTVARILAQLRSARIGSPWLWVLLAGAALGAGLLFLLRNRKRKWLIPALTGLLLLLPLSLGVLLASQINGIRPLTVFTGGGEVPNYAPETFETVGESWYFGFGQRQIIPDGDSDDPLYIAGYNSGVEITGVLDYCQARAVWLDTGGEGILIIGIDCVALDSGTVSAIRQRLSDLPNCAGVNVYATHTHAGIDTLGLWGPLAVNGKNGSYMEALIQAAEEAGREAAASRKPGTLHYGVTQTWDMYRDSRDPQVYDENLYQLRFASADGKGLRMYFYGAHAESLRGANTLLSRDFPGVLCDNVTAATGDDTMFFPGAIGGLIMTKEFTQIPEEAVENRDITAEKLVEYALSIYGETELEPDLALSRKKFVVPMDNIAFLLLKALGILKNRPVPAESATGYGVETELSVLALDGVAVALLPGEIFPELVLGGEYGRANINGKNPRPLCKIAEEQGIETLIIAGLVNDEIGYIVPPSDFLVNEKMPYLERTMDYKGEDHYEETNSIGPECAGAVADAFAEAVKALGKS